MGIPEQSSHRWIVILLVVFVLWLIWRISTGYPYADCEQYETIGDSMIIGERVCPEEP
jgi:hypothetical protein